MNFVLTLRGTLRAFCVVLLLATQTSFAETQTLPAPRIAVVDVQFIEENSEVWKDLRTKIDALRQQYQALAQQEEDAFKQKALELRRQKNVLSPEDFEAQEVALRDQLQALQKKSEDRKRLLEKQFFDGRTKIRAALRQALASLMETYDLHLIFNQSTVTGSLILSTNEISLNEEALEALNQKIQTISLTLIPDSQDESQDGAAESSTDSES